MPLKHLHAPSNARRWRSATFFFVLLLWPALESRADEIALWNFNDSNLMVDRGSGSLTTSFPAANFNFANSGTTVNAQMGDAAEESLTLVNQSNNGGNITLNVSTAGFTNVAISFATQRTGTGFNSNQFQYSLDGVDFINFMGNYNPPTSFGLMTFDLSSIAGLNNNSLAAFRIIFNGASSATGNNRIDNLLVAGTNAPAAAVPEPATLLLLGTGLAGIAAKVRRRQIGKKRIG